jgi:hypothetical protein
MLVGLVICVEKVFHMDITPTDVIHVTLISVSNADINKIILN